MTTHQQLVASLADWELAMPPSPTSPSSPMESLDWGSLDLKADERGSFSSRSSRCSGGASSQQSERLLRSFLAAAADTFACKLQRDVTFIFSHTPNIDPATLAAQLSASGYHAAVRRAVGGGGASCFRSLRHEFLLVKGEGMEGRDDYVLDLKFREQFEIPHPTPSYRALLAHLPAAFVGPASALTPIVQLLCTEMAESFKVQGLALPPWRRTQSVLSKWVPAIARDLGATSAPFSATSASPTAMQEGSPASASDAASRAYPGMAGAGGMPIRIPQQPLQHMIKFGFAI